jgi:exonuclease III
VATFARSGLTLAATATAFGDSSLDSEGRCIMTDHGSFVLFNVYVPYSGFEYVRLAYKVCVVWCVLYCYV